MTIHASYFTVADDSARPENWARIMESNVTVTFCNHYSHTAERVILIDAGGGGGHILDESNGITLYSYVDGWESSDMDEDDSSDTYDNVRNEWPIIAHHGSYDYTSICVDPEEIAAATLETIMSVAESFQDYPVLDESDYSEREFKAFVEEFDFSSRRIDDDYTPDHPQYIAATEYAMDKFYGMSDPGYISYEDVEKCWKETA